MFTIVKGPIAAHGRKKKSLTCTTCGLKKCVGRCRFEPAGSPRVKKPA